MSDHEIQLTAEIVRFDGPRGWHAIFLPSDAAAEIRFFWADRASALGAITVWARLGGTEWKTSLFPDSGRETYMLPLKAAVRLREDVKEGDRVALTLRTGLRHA